MFQRAEQLLGTDAMKRIGAQRVIIFGVGGVGSWCAEALVRTGIQHLTLVDFDRVDVSNINRQLMATSQTVGQVKVDALRDRLLAINPNADITALPILFNEESAPSFRLEDYDFIIDAIDSLKDKALLIELACQKNVKFFSSMGAALKLDPTRVQVAEFWKVKGDPLARRKFKCVFSDESPQQVGEVKGSLVQITAVFGMTLASLVIQDITSSK